MIWASLHVIVALLSFFNGFKYHPCYNIPLAILVTLMWMMWGGAFGGMVVAKHYVKKTTDICPPTGGSGWDKLDKLYLDASQILCSQVCPCNAEYARLYPADEGLVFTVGGAMNVQDCPQIEEFLTPD